jgi:hypothetical protein
MDLSTNLSTNSGFARKFVYKAAFFVYKEFVPRSRAWEARTLTWLSLQQYSNSQYTATKTKSWRLDATSFF